MANKIITYGLAALIGTAGLMPKAFGYPRDGEEKFQWYDYTLTEDALDNVRRIQGYQEKTCHASVKVKGKMIEFYFEGNLPSVLKLKRNLIESIDKDKDKFITTKEAKDAYKTYVVEKVLKQYNDRNSNRRPK